jgi:hypothetical protein
MTSPQLTLPFGPIRNSNLFSNHWLEHRLLLEPEWVQHREAAVRVLGRLGQLWRQQRSRVEQYSEASLEQALIQPVLKELGWEMVYQTFLRGRKPDYALFLTDRDVGLALEAGPKAPEFWQYATIVADAKAWAVNLDRPAIVDNQREYPPEQIEWYIHHSQRQYGILTNGGLWRLYAHDLSPHQPRFSTYFECDLGKLLEQWISAGDNRSRIFAEDNHLIDDFLTFYLFFGPAAFVSIETRKPLIKRAIEGSNEYRLGVSEGLKERVFEALRICIHGLISHSANELDPKNDLGLCREQSLILLYRLLFVMYAEDRELLPYRSNRLYRENRSLRRLRDEIGAQLDSLKGGTGEDFDRDSQGLWEDLLSLFDLIDSGKKSYGVPPYNGGLFDPHENNFLDDKVLPDWHLARMIDQLGRAPDADHPDAGLFRVDYRDLSIQHLGHVYEGLLELHPQWAREPMKVVRKRNHQRAQERVIPSSERTPADFEDTGITYECEEVYLLTDKGERRATGSYYTPDHIVDHIIQQTLRPVCQEITDRLRRELKQAEEDRKRARGLNRQLLDQRVQDLRNDFDDRVLRLRVLDPAMGSGHFLLRACQYLAEEIATNPYASDPSAGQLLGDEPVLTFWKRRVVEHCLYGVDINPLAVELAKVGLWLETAAMGQPLTFLDHHLRCGNSLVGGRIADLGALPGLEPLPLFEQQTSYFLPGVLNGLKQIIDRPSDTRDQVKAKAKIYHETVDRVRKPFVSIADLWCATFFVGKVDLITPERYQEALQTLATPAKHQRLLTTKSFRNAIKIARRRDVACFHWELEFPEVFFDLTGRRPEAGFDAVIGNPPYDVLSEKETGHELTSLKEFLKAQAIYRASFRGKNNLYKLFVCLALSLLREGGRMGFITPMAILGDDQAADLRRMLLEHGAFTSIDAFPQKDDPRRRVFPQAKLSTTVFSYQKTQDPILKVQQYVSRVHPAQYVEANSPALTFCTEGIPLYDPTNLTIVSCSQKDWDLATMIMSSGKMRRLGDVCTSFQGEVNETNDRNGGRITYDRNSGPEAMRGAHLCLYTLREASQGTPVYVIRDQFLARADKDSKAFHHQYARIGFQRKSPQNNFRRLIAAPIPQGIFIVESISYVPEHMCSIPLDIVLAILNSRLADWYFRIGSTNAMVGEYQVTNLPCPVFVEVGNTADKKIIQAATTAVKNDDFDSAFRILLPGIKVPPFSLAIRDTIIFLVNGIIEAERARGEISRAERSALSPQAQPYQDLIDRLLYAMAGLSDDEARGLEKRLAKML